MRRVQTVRTALSSISRNKLRTALTMLGLVIGISSVIVLVGMGDGSNRQVEERMKALGGDILSVFVFDEDGLAYEDMEALRALPGIGSVAPSKSVGGDLTAGTRKTKRGMVEASDEHYLSVRNLKLAAGRSLSSVDRENRSNVCVIGTNTANDLFGTADCVGKTLKIAGIPFTVVGVLESTGQTMGLNADGLVLVPLTAATNLGGDAKIESVYARPAADDGVPLAKAVLTGYLSGAKGIPSNQFSVMSQDEMLGASDQINQTMTLLLGGIASISLVVAGVGVMNVMLVSVTERTREIGIKKALGARRSDILRQFLVEALLLSLIGGGVGIAAGLAFGALAEGMGMAFAASWGVVGVGFLALALSFANLGAKRADLHGIFSYADAGWGPLAGFISGWGYWLSAWLGNVAFATMMMSTIGYFYPAFLPGNTIPCIIIASIVMWALTYLVIRGVESAAFLNAIVMVCKVAAIAVTLIFGIFLFNAGIFTADFWGQLSANAAAMAGEGADLGSVGDQIVNCLIIMMWSFIGIEGAMVVSARARKKSEAGKATVIGLVVLLLVYVGASVLPFGYLPYAEIGALDKPAMLYVFESMAPGWGGAFISVALIIAVLGSWLSFTILPSETTSLMAEHRLLPPVFNKLNKKGSPQISLIVVGACTQAFMITLLFTEDAYNFAFSMCTVAIVITWAFAAAYQAKWGVQNKNMVQAAIGFVAVAFQVIGVLFNGWSFLLLTCVGYIPGFFIYVKARKDYGNAITMGEKVCMGVVSALGVLSLVLLAMGVISI